MPVYIYKAKKGPVESTQGEIEAASQDEAVSKLEAMGLTPVSVVAKEKIEKIEKKKEEKKENSTFFSFGIKTTDIDTFTRQLASLIRASVSVVGALDLISRETENKALKSVVSSLAAQVKDGKLLSEAMESHGNLFNNLYFSMIKAGEKAGALDVTLTRLADYREKDEEIRRKIQAALAYPALMITVGVGTIFMMLTYFLPKLVGLFENMRQALPLPTRILIGVSKFMSGNWYWILLIGVLAIAILGRVRHGSKKKLIFDAILLRIPVLKKFILDSEISKFTKTLGLLLESGISIHESLDLAAKTLDNDVLRASLSSVSNEIISHGATLSGSLKKVDIFPRFALSMIAVGEEGGKLEGALKEVCASYERELEQAVKMMTALLEPILILAIGAVVGFIVFAMLLPVFNIGIMGR